MLKFLGWVVLIVVAIPVILFLGVLLLKFQWWMANLLAGWADVPLWFVLVSGISLELSSLGCALRNK